jgi:hypothetical protein
MSLAKVGKNQQYANYLFGLGVGLLIGASYASGSHQRMLIVFATIDLIAAMVLYYWVTLKEKKNG